jgi:hypothetical protein
MRKIVLIFLFLAVCSTARGQTNPTNNNPPPGANLTTAGTSTSYTVTSAAWQQVGTTQGVFTVGVTGTWAGTLSFYASVLGQPPVAISATPSNSSTTVTTTTGNGAWYINSSGFSVIYVIFTTATSGTAVVTINPANVSFLPAGGGGGGVTSLNSETGAISILPGTGITVTNGSGTITIAATGTGTIGGSIATNQVAVGSGANTIAGTSDFTWVDSTMTLNIGNSATPTIQMGPTAAAGNPGILLNTGLLSPNAVFSQTAGIALNVLSTSVLLTGATGTAGAWSYSGTTGYTSWFGATSGSAAIGAAAVAGTPNPMLLPITTGSSGQVLSTNGANPQQLSWVANGGTPAFPVTVTGGVSGGIPCFTSTTTEAASTLLQLNSPVVGGGAGACPTTQNTLQLAANTYENFVQSTATTFEGGSDGSSLGVLGQGIFRGGDQTGAGGAFSGGGSALIRGGNNAATNAGSEAGSVEIAPGMSNGATQGQQGLLILSDFYIKGGGTSTQWNLQCIVGTTAMTVNDCGATPPLIQGVAAQVNANTVLTHTLASQTPVNASAAVTVGDTVCAGATAGVVTDSGGTGQCTTGITVGNVLAVSGTYFLPITGSVTLSTTLPLIQIQRTQATGAASSVAWANVTSGANAQTGAFSSAAPWTYSFSGTASTSANLFTGTPFSGTGTTAVPLLYMNGGTAPTTWAATGTYMGVNAVSGFTGNFIDFHLNGGASLFSVSNTGVVNSSGRIQSSSNIIAATSITVDNNGGGSFLSFASNKDQIGTAGVGTNGDIQGTITVTASTSGTTTFAAAYTTAARCIITPTSDPTAVGVYWVTSNTTSVTANIKVSGTITFNYICIGAPG